MGQTYFITGAQGCIGSWVVKTLVERGDTPVVFDQSDDPRRLRSIMDDDATNRVQFLIGDVTDFNGTLKALAESGARRVIHLAGLQVPTCKADPATGAMVNVVGTINVFEAARAVSVERVVYASSAAVFGVTEDGRAVDESTVCEPSTHYGVFKRANEGNARIFFLDFGLCSVGLRPLTVYGVGRDFGLTSDPTKAMKAAVLGRRFHIKFSGPTDFLYVADTAAAFIACADRAPAGAHVFNLHGDTVDVADCVRTIDEHLPQASRGLITFGGPPIPIAPELNGNAIRQTIGNLQSTQLSKGVAETISLFTTLRDQGRLDTGDLD
ncbi:MAG TPA: NAD-dependent epimerase/dehydratase family protein [Blastocatellia bacterium]|nr:NAD-dependent epimerase/dehydratase family protein [Blastocatellia bacterium]